MQRSRVVLSLRVPKKARASRIILAPSHDNDPLLPVQPPGKVRSRRARATQCVTRKTAGGRASGVCACDAQGPCARGSSCARRHDGE
jgi:hypothetical protein